MINNLIIIPYRDRNSHLKYFLKHVFPSMKKNLVNIRLVVIEQSKGNLFNKGALINIAYDIYKDKSDSMIIHDIDIYPNEECVKKYYSQDFNGVVGICVSPCNTLGGVIKISNKHFKEVNGFPNNFWGWGVEDKALQNRVEYREIQIQKNFIRPEGKFNEYFIDDHTNHSRIRNNFINYKSKHIIHYRWWNRFSQNIKEAFLKSSGINNLKYQIISKKNIDQYDHYVVEILKSKKRNFREKIKLLWVK
jgi:hypothetical protein